MRGEQELVRWQRYNYVGEACLLHFMDGEDLRDGRNPASEYVVGLMTYVTSAKIIHLP